MDGDMEVHTSNKHKALYVYQVFTYDIKILQFKYIGTLLGACLL